MFGGIHLEIVSGDSTVRRDDEGLALGKIHPEAARLDAVRRCGDAVDVGAYESESATPLFIRGDCNGDGNTGGVVDALMMLTRNRNVPSVISQAATRLFREKYRKS